MSSGIKDARVLAAFAQGVQRPYMLGVEQRLSEAGTSLERLTGGAAGWARLNHASVSTTNDFTTTSSSAVDVTDLTLGITTYGGSLLLIAVAEMFYVDTTAAATGEFGFSVDGGSDVFVWQHDVVGSDNDTYGLAAIRLVSVPAGRHVIKGRAKTSAGTLNLVAGTAYPIQMLAVEL